MIWQVFRKSAFCGEWDEEYSFLSWLEVEFMGDEIVLMVFYLALFSLGVCVPFSFPLLLPPFFLSSFLSVLLPFLVYFFSISSLARSLYRSLSPTLSTSPSLRKAAFAAILCPSTKIPVQCSTTAVNCQLNLFSATKCLHRLALLSSPFSKTTRLTWCNFSRFSAHLLSSIIIFGISAIFAFLSVSFAFVQLFFTVFLISVFSSN